MYNELDYGRRLPPEHSDAARISVSQMFQYDLVIVGAGSGNAIPDGAFANWKIAVVEESLFGGTCLQRGCIPSKMFVHTADIAQNIRRSSRFGVESNLESVDWPAIRNRVFGRIDPMHQQAVNYRRRNGVDVYLDHAEFVDANTLKVGSKSLTAKRFLIASGSRPMVPEVAGLDEVGFYTSDDIMRIDSLPESLMIVGGGYIASEMAHIFGSLGVEISMIVRDNRLLSKHDRSINRRFTEIQQARHNVFLNSEVDSFTSAGNRVAARVKTPTGAVEVGVDAVLIATGRVPNTDLLNVAAAGVAVDEHGHVIKDARGQTNVDHIWALGDAANHWQLKHVANAEAQSVFHNISRPDEGCELALPTVPSAVFGDPQVATVGETEEQLAARGAEFVVSYRGFDATAYGWALEDESGFVKILADPVTRTILGAHVLGHEAALLIQPLVQAIMLGSTVDEVGRGVIYLHPSLCEVVEQALLEL